MAEEPDSGALIRVEFPAKDSNMEKASHGDEFGWSLQNLVKRNTSIFRAANGPCGCAESPQRGKSHGTTNSILIRSFAFGQHAATVYLEGLLSAAARPTACKEPAGSKYAMRGSSVTNIVETDDRLASGVMTR